MRADTSYANLTSLSGRLASAQAQLLQLQELLAEEKARVAALETRLREERSARLVAEDAEVARRQLAERGEELAAALASLRDELGQERRSKIKVVQEMELLTVSRDTWRVRGRVEKGLGPDC